MKNVLAKVIAYAGPGGCGKLKRGEKAYLMKKKELTGQLSELDANDLVFHNQLLEIRKLVERLGDDGEEEIDRNYFDGDAVRQSGARKGKISGSTQ